MIHFFANSGFIILLGASILAQIPVPPPDLVGRVIWALIAIAAVVVLVLTGIVQWKKAFGRAPPLNEILAGLVSEQTMNEYKKEATRVSDGVSNEITKLRVEVKEEYKAAEERAEERRQELIAMRDQVSKLQERTETHIRQLDKLDGKVDRLLGRLPL